MGDDEPDISELAEKAKIVAEATGRDEADVLADLYDDGINMSNEDEKSKDLVTQLKEAAELITTVQSINKEVSKTRFSTAEKIPQKSRWKLLLKATLWIGRLSPFKESRKTSRNWLLL